MKLNVSELENLKKRLGDLIIKLNRDYDGSKEKYEELEELYNLFHRVCDVLTEKKGIYQGESETYFTNVSPCIFVVDAKPNFFELDDEMLKEVSHPKKSYTLEEAETLIKWTVNNTINNLCLIHGGDNLTGCCGFSQFSSLYPLKKLGLKVTINNASSFGGCSHAFGTVTLPIDMNGDIIEKQYLIDCTYSQFFILYNCVESMYLKDDHKGIERSPDAGYFIRDDIEKQQFVSKMINDGYCEFNADNMKKYAFGLYMSMVSKDRVEEAANLFEKIDLVSVINNEKEKFDFEEEEFLELGLNLDVEQNSNKRR